MTRAIRHILFVAPPPLGIDSGVNGIVGLKYPSAPFGIMNLIYAIQTNLPGIGVSFLDFDVCPMPEIDSVDACNGFIDDNLRRYADNKPDMICLSVNFTAAHSFFAFLVERVRSTFPDCCIVAGGAHITASARFISENITECDYLICGEGEEALPGLIRFLEGNQSQLPAGVHPRGAISLSDIGEPVRSPAVQNIDIDYKSIATVVDFSPYLGSHAVTFGSVGRKREHLIMASRGCPCSCTFCPIHLVHGKFPRWRSITNIRHELLWFHENHDVNRFLVMDDNFVPKHKTMELLAMLKALPVPDKEFQFYNMSVNHMDFDILDSMAEANVVEISLAIESASPEMQKKLKKYCDLDKSVALVRYAQKLGIAVKCLYIVGLPRETLNEVNATIDFAKNMDSDWAAFNVAVPALGTEMYTEFLNLGYIEDSPECWKALNYKNRLFDTREFRAAEIEGIAYSANLDMNFANSRQIRIGKLDVAEALYGDFVRIIDHHLFAHDCLRRVFRLKGEIGRMDDEILKMKRIMSSQRHRVFWGKYLHLLEYEIRSVLCGK